MTFNANNAKKLKSLFNGFDDSTESPPPRHPPRGPHQSDTQSDPERSSDSYEPYEREMHQTRAGYITPVSTSLHDSARKHFSGFGKNNEWGPGNPEYDDTPTMPTLPPVPLPYDENGNFEPGKIDDYISELHK